MNKTVAREEELRRQRARAAEFLLAREATASVAIDPRPPVASHVVTRISRKSEEIRRAFASQQWDVAALQQGVGNDAVRRALGPETTQAARQQQTRRSSMMSDLLGRDADYEKGWDGMDDGVGEVAESAPAAEAAGPQASGWVVSHDPLAGLDVSYNLAGGAPEVDIKQVGQALGSGRGLDTDTREYMEWRFGVSFDRVRMHTGPKADAISKALFAHAFALGADVAFQSNTYRPGTREGDRLLAHELTHVVQAGQAKAIDIEGRDEVVKKASVSPLGRSIDPGLAKSSSVSEPTDGFEVEADAMADWVVSVGRSEFAAWKRDRRPGAAEETRKSASFLLQQALSTPGRALPEQLRGRLESRFGRDLSNVRIHVDETAAQAASAVNAKALTVGDHILFGQDQYQPGTPTGDELIAHEVTHAVQHAEGREGPAGGMEGDVAVTAESSDVEVEAREVGDEFKQGRDEDASNEAAAEVEGVGVEEAAPAVYARGEHAPEAPAEELEPTASIEPEAGDVAHRTPDPPEGDKDKEKKPEDYSEDEIQDEVKKTKTDGSSKDPGAEVKPEGEAKAVDESTPAQEEAQALDPDANAALQDIPPAAMPATANSGLKTLGEVKSGFSEWDNETAWHGYFTKGEGELKVDKMGLATDAILEGLGEGVLDGAKQIVIGQAMAAASKKIPYLSGFVEIAKIAYDPKAWLENTSQNTLGKFSQAGDLWKGGIVDKMEAILTVVEGVNNIIGTISNILWVVAAAGFIASFFFPFLIPFVAWCASAAKTLTAITSILGMFITLGKLILTIARAVALAYAPSDPAELIHQTKHLKESTKGFTGDFTANAGDSLIDRAKGALSKSDASTAPPAPDTPEHAPAAPPKQTAWKKTLSIVTGEFGSSGEIGSGMVEKQASYAQSKQELAAATAKIQEPGPQQKAAEAELAEHEAKKQATKEQLDAARTKTIEAGDEARKKQEVLDAALKKISDAESDKAFWEPRDKEKLAEIQKDLEHYESARGKALDAAEAKATEAEEWETMVKEAGDDPSLSEIKRQSLQEAEKLRSSEKRLRDAAKSAEQSYDMHTRRVQDLKAREERVDAALAEAKSLYPKDSEEGVTFKQEVEAIQASAKTADEKYEALKEAFKKLEDKPGAADEAKKTKLQKLWANVKTSYEHSKDSGDSGAHGKGGLIKVIDDLGLDEKAQKQMGPLDTEWDKLKKTPKGAVDGFWKRTMDGKPVDPYGKVGAGTIQDAQTEYEAGIAALPKPPAAKDLDQINASKTAWDKLDLEQRQVQFQIITMAELKKQGVEEMTGLDVLNSVAEANRAGIEEHQGSLDTKKDAQDDMKKKAEDGKKESQKGEDKGSEGKTTSGPFITKFMELLGIVPGSLVGGDGGGASKMGGAMDEQKEGSAKAKEKNEEAKKQSEDWKKDTDGAKQSAATDDANLQGLQQQIAASQASDVEGMAFIDTTTAQGQDRLAVIASQKESEKSKHDGVVGAMGAWIPKHQAAREKLLGPLHGKAELVKK